MNAANEMIGNTPLFFPSKLFNYENSFMKKIWKGFAQNSLSWLLMNCASFDSQSAIYSNIVCFILEKKGLTVQ